MNIIYNIFWKFLAAVSGLKMQIQNMHAFGVNSLVMIAVI